MKGRKVFVTGGALGIGRAIVTAFAQAGAEVAFCDIDEAAGVALCKNFPDLLRFYPLDVTDGEGLREVINEVINRYGDLDILINNVGIGQFQPLTTATVENFDRVISTNLRPVFITSAALARHRGIDKANAPRYGRIINISSSRYLQSEPGTEAYAASKGGVVSLTHALAASFANSGITVNCISPGWIETNDYDQISAEDHAQHFSGRVGKPDDIAQMCLFLCRPEQDFINGQNFTVDGGMTKKMIYL